MASIITLYGELTPRNGLAIINQFEDAILRSETFIQLVINSPGGDLETATQIRIVLDAIPIPVEGIVFRQAGSCAFSLLQHCTYRSAMSNAFFMTHAPQIQSGVDYPDYDYMLAAMRKFHASEMQYFSRRSGQRVDQWHRWALETRIFTAPEALSLGIIECIHFNPQILLR